VTKVQKCRLPVLLMAVALQGAAMAADAPPASLQALIGNPEHFSISGSFRARYEALDGQFRANPDRSDSVVALRSTLALEYHDHGLRIGGELLDARVYFDDRNSGVGPNDVNTFEPIQLYAGADFKDAFSAGDRLSVTGGRFTLDLGSRRFVARNDYRNDPNAFTGGHIDWRGAGGTAVTLLYTLPQQRLPSGRSDVRNNRTEYDLESTNLQFWGAFVSVPKLLPKTTTELYFFGLDEGDLAGRPTRNRHLYTPGGRLVRKPAPGSIDYEIEGAYQFGDARTSTAATARKENVSAFFARAQIGTTFKAPWSPRVALAVDIASGDESSSGKLHRFDTLFGARRFDFGPTGIYGPLGRANLVSPELRLELKPTPVLDALLAYRAAWLESQTDSFSSTGIRDARGASGRFAGQQVEARIRYWLVPKRVQWEVGAATFIDEGQFVQLAPNSGHHGNTYYGYTSILTTF